MALTQALHRSVQQRPNETAVIDGAREFSFCELVDRVGRLAGGLTGLGVRPGDRIAILAANSAEYLEYALVCSWLGAVACPINNRWTLSEAAFQIDETETAIILVDAARLPAALSLRDRCESLVTVVGFGEGERPDGVVDYECLIEANEPMEDRRSSGEELALLMYTGGTTGRPKGVMLSERQLLTAAWGAGMSAGRSNLPERALHVAPLFHLAAYAGIVQHLIIGSTHVMMGEFDVDRLVRTIGAQRITMVTLMPTMLKWMLDHSASVEGDLTSLRCVGYGASPMPTPLLSRLRESLPQVSLRQGYGMTELGPVATLLRNEDHHDANHPERLRSVGRAALHNEVRVVGPDGKELPCGAIGELVVAGPNVMMGYWRNEEATKQALRDGWMHTGDAGYMDEYGYFYLVDRIKDMIISGGENVYSAEVEKAIYEHEAISSCAVIGVPDEVWGERVHAVVVLKDDATLSATELRDFVGHRIARYKAPQTVDFVAALPLSPVGKVLKRVLRDQYRCENPVGVV